MKKMHLIMPMGGQGSRFFAQGFEVPKPLVELCGKPFFYWSVQSIRRFIPIEDLIFVVLKAHVQSHQIDQRILQVFPDAIIRVIPEVLNGAVLTCLEAVKEVSDQNPIVFNDCDHMFRCKRFEDFAAQGFDDAVSGGLLTFLSDSEKYSYLKLDDAHCVTQTVEKKAISNQAICGCYYFANKSVFAEAAAEYLRLCAYEEFFVSGVYNIMAKYGKQIRAFQTDFHVPFGVPEEYEEAKSSKYFDDLIS